MSAVESRFAWHLSQPRIELLAETLYKVETILNIASPGGRSADDIARLLTDLRAQTATAGAADPFPDMPMFPAFPDTAIPMDSLGLWPEDPNKGGE